MWRMHPEIENVLDLIDGVSVTEIGREAIITSARDGTHSVNSLHYKGAAIDLRIRDIEDPADLVQYWEGLKDALGSNWDVILETSHIHVEYDPE